MTTFTFKPSAKAFPNAGDVARTIEVEIDKLGNATVNGNQLSNATMQHAIAFAIKQRLANSFVSAATAKNDEGGLLPESERLALWGSSFDKVLAKITDPAASPDWQSVFTGRAEGEPADPFLAEVNRVATQQLREYAKAKGKTLPKATSDEFKSLLAKWLDAKRDAIESEARRRLAAVADIELDDDDFDLDDVK